MDAAARRGTPADGLIRSQHKRHTLAGEKLRDRLARSESLGEVEFTLSAVPDRPACLVRQTLYRESVTLPVRKGAPGITVTAILARKERLPAGQNAVEWRLLTHRIAESLDAVVELIEGYRRRRRGEIFSRF